jgi:excisionase family DNA binding protein
MRTRSLSLANGSTGGAVTRLAKPYTPVLSTTILLSPAGLQDRRRTTKRGGHVRTNEPSRVAYPDGHVVQEDDPYRSLGAALQAVIEQAVSSALAPLPASAVAEQFRLSVPEAAEQLGIGTTKVKQLIAAGWLASVTIGRRRLVPAASIRAFGAVADEHHT